MKYTANIDSTMPIKRIENDDGIEIYDQMSLHKMNRDDVRLDDYAGVALTSCDNPFNPFTEFDKWYAYDTEFLGYNTCSKLAREAELIPSLGVFAQQREDERAVDEMVKMNATGNYVKVIKRSSPNK